MDKPDRRSRPETGWLAFRDVPPCVEETLDNGVHLHIVDNGTMPANRVSIISGFGTETAARTTSIPAVSLASALITEGTTSRSGAEIAANVDFEGAMVNSRLTEHHSSITVAALNSSLPRLVPVLADIFRNADFPDHAFRAARIRSAQRYNVESTRPAVVAGRLLNRLILGENHPLSAPNDADAIMATSRQIVAQTHRIIRDSASAHIFFGGKADKDTIAALRSLGAGLRPAPPASPLVPEITPPMPEPAGKHYIAMPESLQTAIAIAIPAIPRNHPDYHNLRLTVMALGGYFGSRLMTNIREEKGLTYGIGAYLLGNLDGASVSISAQCPNGTADTVINEICNEIDALATAPMPEDELTRLRRYAMSQLITVLDTPFAIADYYQCHLLYGTPDTYFEDQFRAISNLSPETIMNTAATYLLPQQMRIVTAGA